MFEPLVSFSRTCPLCGRLVFVRNECFTIHWPDLESDMWCSNSGVHVDAQTQQSLEKYFVTHE